MNELTHQLAQLERTQLVRRLDDPEIAYLFKHVLAQETTYQSLLVKTRRDIHLRVAQYYEQFGADTPDTNAAILAHHYLEAGDYAKTFHYALSAGDIAARLYAHPEALMHYDTARQMVHRLSAEPVLSDSELATLYTNRGRVFELSNRYDLAVENYLEMESAGRARDNSALEVASMILRATLLSTYTTEFNPPVAAELNARILARAIETGDRAAQARIHWIMLLLAKYGSADMPQSIAHGEQALALARELGMRELVAYTLNDLAYPYGLTGQFETSRAGLKEAIDIWQDLGNLAMLSDTITNIMQLEYYAGDLQGAAVSSAEALRLSQMTGSLWGQAYSQMWIGPALAEQGEYSTALRVMDECLRIAKAANFLPPQVATQIDHAWVLGELGLIEQALQEAEQASGLLESIPPFSIFVLTVKLRLALLAGNLAAAEQVSNQELFRSDSPFRNEPDGATRIALAEAELAMAYNDYPRAVAILEPAIEFLRKHKVVPFLPELLYLQGQALAAQGDTPAALAVLSDARHRAEALPSRRMLWQILDTLAELETEHGNFETAKALRLQAHGVLEYIIAHLGSPALETSFTALPRVRALLQAD